MVVVGRGGREESMSLDQFHREQAGRSYRPSNGEEGNDFAEAFCDVCNHGGACRIADAAFWLPETDPGYPAEWIYAADGSGPTCTAFDAVGGKT